MCLLCGACRNNEVFLCMLPMDSFEYDACIVIAASNSPMQFLQLFIVLLFIDK